MLYIRFSEPIHFKTDSLYPLISIPQFHLSPQPISNYSLLCSCEFCFCFLRFCIWVISYTACLSLSSLFCLISSRFIHIMACSKFPSLKGRLRRPVGDKAWIWWENPEPERGHSHATRDERHPASVTSRAWPFWAAGHSSESTCLWPFRLIVLTSALLTVATSPLIDLCTHLRWPQMGSPGWFSRRGYWAFLAEMHRQNSLGSCWEAPEYIPRMTATLFQGTLPLSWGTRLSDKSVRGSQSPGAPGFSQT